MSLDGSKKYRIESDDLITEESLLDIYGKRYNYFSSLRSCNLLFFLQNYFVTGGKLIHRRSPADIRTGPCYSSNPNSGNYDKFCKYQLIKYKPWVDSINNLWGNTQVTDTIFIESWHDFLSSENGKNLVPEWEVHLLNTEVYLQQSAHENDSIVHNPQLDWMHVAGLNGSNMPNMLTENIENYLNDSRAAYPLETIRTMPFWIESIKSSQDQSSLPVPASIDLNSLNTAQRLCYNIIETHLSSNIDLPLLMIITGQAGSGKSYLISAIKQLLSIICIVTSFFGIAAFNINGQTLHSLLKLPIRGKRSNDLKGQALATLRDNLASIKYIIIDEFSVICQKMLGWIDRRCRQGTGNSTKLFGGLSVLLVGDTAQLPPIPDKVLYRGHPSNEVALQGFCAYQQFKLVVKLLRNERASSVSASDFRSLLIRLRNGESTEEDWHLLMQRKPENFTDTFKQSFDVKLAFENSYVEKYNLEQLHSLQYGVI